jgi:hypothetical protein
MFQKMILTFIASLESVPSFPFLLPSSSLHYILPEPYLVFSILLTSLLVPWWLSHTLLHISLADMQSWLVRNLLYSLKPLPPDNSSPCLIPFWGDILQYLQCPFPFLLGIFTFGDSMEGLPIYQTTSPFLAKWSTWLKLSQPDISSLEWESQVVVTKLLVIAGVGLSWRQ